MSTTCELSQSKQHLHDQINKTKILHSEWYILTREKPKTASKWRWYPLLNYMSCITSARLYLFPIFEQGFFRASLVSLEFYIDPTILGCFWKDILKGRAFLRAQSLPNHTSVDCINYWLVYNLGIGVLRRIVGMKRCTGTAEQTRGMSESTEGTESACKCQGESTGHVVIIWTSCSVNLRFFQSSWRLSCYFTNVSLTLVNCFPSSSVFSRRQLPLMPDCTVVQQRESKRRERTGARDVFSEDKEKGETETWNSCRLVQNSPRHCFCSLERMTPCFQE